MRMLIAVAATCLCASALAQAQSIAPIADWMNARPALAVSVTPSTEAGVYIVRATVTDLETAKTLATPEVKTTAAGPATLEAGIEGKILVKLVVTVDSSGRTASYIATVRRDGRVESQHEATLTLPDRT